MLTQKENDNSNMFRKFQVHSMQIFLKMVTSNFKEKNKLKKVASTPHPPTLTAFPALGYKWYPHFFIKMTEKDVKKITYNMS